MSSAPEPQDYRNATFILSAAKLGQCPADVGVEVAFAGRSNAGKSSAINAICDHNKLARASKTPGRTQQINFFALAEDKRLVDLPATASRASRWKCARSGQGWSRTTSASAARWPASCC